MGAKRTAANTASGTEAQDNPSPSLPVNTRHPNRATTAGKATMPEALSGIAVCFDALRCTANQQPMRTNIHVTYAMTSVAAGLSRRTINRPNTSAGAVLVSSVTKV